MSVPFCCILLGQLNEGIKHGLQAPHGRVGVTRVLWPMYAMQCPHLVEVVLQEEAPIPALIAGPIRSKCRM